MDEHPKFIIQSLVTGTTDSWQTVASCEATVDDAAVLHPQNRGNRPPQIPAGQYRVIYLDAPPATP